MEEFLAVFWILVIVVAVIVAIAFHAHRSKTLDDAYRNLAHRLGGSYTPGGVFGRPTLSFHHHGVWAMVDIYSTGGKHPTYYTQLHIAWPDKTTRLEVYPERFTSRIGKMLGMLDVEIGSPEFDREFIISGNSVQAMREVLTPDVQAMIYRLRRLRHNDHIYVSIGGGRMLVKKLGWLRDEASLRQFIDAALDLYDLATARSAEGIEIVGESQLAEPAEVVCQICGETIAEELVHCRRCKTPHHEDCWQYFGGCSTFGCGERRYTTTA